MKIPLEVDTVRMNKWRQAIKTVESGPTPIEYGEKLSEGTWLIAANGGLPLLGRCVYQAEKDALEYVVVFLAEAPQVQRCTPLQKPASIPIGV